MRIRGRETSAQYLFFQTVFLLFASLWAPARTFARDEEALSEESLSALMSSPLSEEEASTMSGRETVVRESRPKMSGGACSVERAAVRDANPASADEILNLVPGIKIVQHGAEGKGHQIFMQGFDAAHGSDVEATLMGVPLNEPSHVHGQGYLDLYGIIPETVSKMEVQKGAFLPRQGDFAVAGSLNFYLAIPDELRPGFVSMEASHRGRIRAAAVAAPKGEDDETFVAAQVVRDPGFGPDREAFRAAFLGQKKHSLGSGRSLSALLSLQSARFESPETLRLSDVKDNRVGFWGAYGPAGHGLSDRALMSVSFRVEKEDLKAEAKTFGLVREFSLEENFTGSLLYSEHGDLRRQAQHGGAAGGGATMEKRLPVSFPLSLHAGLGWRFDRTFQKEQQLEPDGTPWQVNRDLDFFIHEVYGFTGIRLSPFEFVDLFPSLRVVTVTDIVNDRLEDVHGSNTEVAALPRLAASFPVHDKVTLFADYGRGYRSPEARSVTAEASSSVEDENLSQYEGGASEIVIADSVELGAELDELLGVLRISLFGFAVFLEKEMVFDHVSNLNVAKDGTRRFGVTADVAFTPFSWMMLTADVTWTRATFNRSGNYVPGVPLWMGSADMSMGKQRGPRGRAALRWCGKRPLAHGATASGYAVLDIGIAWRFDRFEVSAQVDNVLNQQIMEGVYHFASRFNEEESRSLIPSIHYAAGEPVTGRFFLTVYL